MQNRYTRDIGNFSKLGLLRALRSAGLSIGLNWYLTPDEAHNGDGRHVGYLRQDEYRTCDEELAGYYAQGSTVVCYQHKARRKDPFYANQLDELLGRDDLPDATGLALKFEKVSQRYYMLIVQPKHREAVEEAVRGMLSTAWGEHFRLL